MLDPNKYTIQIPYIKDWLQSKKDQPIMDQIGPIALAAGLHIALVTYFIGELTGWTPELHAKMDRYLGFYHEEVEGYKQ